MNSYTSANIRNFAIVGHQASGKTMLSECMLLNAGLINRLGSIAAGSTVSDYHEDEQERKISIHSTILNCEWMNRKFNFIDVPGYQDFIGEALGALRVADFALIVVNANNGVELGTERVWDIASQYGIPKVVVVNGFDRENTDFNSILANLRERLDKHLFPLSMPVNPGPGFDTLLDVMRSEICVYQKDASGKFAENSAAGRWKSTVDDLHRELIEHVAEADDSLLEKFFAQGGLTEEELRGGVHAALLAQSFVPVFATDAQHNIGIVRLMDFIAKYGSSPVDRSTVEAHDEDNNLVKVALDGPDNVCYVFKTISEPHVGDLSFFRVYSGTVAPGMDLYNSDRKIIERLGGLFQLNGKTRTAVETLRSGDIGAVVKLRDTHTGNTLCDPKRHLSLPKVQYPHPNIHGALLLKSKGDEDKISAGLAMLHEEDPTFVHRYDGETHQTVLSGQGELHLAILTQRLKKRFNVDIELVEPRVPFRETIKGRADAKYRHKKQTGGAGQFAEVWLRVEPGPRDSGVQFTESLVGQNVDRVFVPSVEKGCLSACTEGVLAGFRIVDLKIDFYDGKMHPVDSKDVAFQVAGKEAFKEAFLAAKPILLEPIYLIEVRVPEDYVGTIMGDISSRRGKIQGIEVEGHNQVVRALVPQMELYRYSTVLRSLTGGRGYHSEKFSHYEEMQKETEQKVIAQRQKERHHD